MEFVKRVGRIHTKFVKSAGRIYSKFIKIQGIMHLKFTKSAGRMHSKCFKTQNSALEICTKCIFSKFAFFFIYTVIERAPGCSDGVTPETVGLVSVHAVSHFACTSLFFSY
jgi:hypothetical protein